MVCPDLAPNRPWEIRTRVEVQIEGQAFKRAIANVRGHKQPVAIKEMAEGQGLSKSSANEGGRRQISADDELARSERFGLPTLGFED